MQPEYSKEPVPPQEDLKYPAGLKPPEPGQPGDSGVQAPGTPTQPVWVQVKLPQIEPVFTYILLGIIVLVYLAGQLIPIEPVVIKGYMVRSAEEWLFLQGAKFNDYILQGGEYYRLLTAMFLHGDLTHLFFNGYALYIIGRGIERLYGHARFLVIYFLGGLTGSVLSLLFSEYASVGASGAIFAIFGAEMIFLYRHRKLFGGLARRRLNNLVFLLAINLFIGLVPGSRIDNWGHAGGFLAGVVLAWFIGPLFSRAGMPTGTPPAIELVDQNPLQGRLVVPVLWLAGLVLVVGAAALL